MLSPAKRFARDTVRGLWIAIPTPFTADGRHVDEETLAASVEHYISALKVDGIFCGGVMGEFWALTLAERMRVHEVVRRQADGRVPVMAQVGHHSLGDTIALARHASEHGIEFGIAMNPYFPPELPDEQVLAYYTGLDAATDLPMFLFNTPYSGTSLSVDLIVRLAELDIVCGIKNPRSLDHLLELQRRAGDRIIVTDAAEGQWLSLHTEHGMQALMSTPALALYQRPDDLRVREYTALADAGRLDDGARAVRDAGARPRRLQALDARPVDRAARRPDRIPEGVARAARPAAGAGPRTARPAHRRAAGRLHADVEAVVDRTIDLSR